MANRTCIIDGCEKSGHAGRGWCWTHYSRWRVYGVPELPEPINPCVVAGCALEGTDTCHYPDCGRRYYARGVCNGHAQQLNRVGRLNPLREKGANGSNLGKTCGFDGCEKPRYARGLCAAHNAQRRAGNELQPLRVVLPNGIPSALVRDESGAKRCLECEAWFPESLFPKSSRKPDGLALRCKPCNSRKARARSLARYGVSVDWYDDQLVAQGGGCAICARQPGRRVLAVDHDHSCCPTSTACGACVRGLLCRNCNTALGFFDDDQSRLSAAANYLAAPPRVTKISDRTPA